MTALSRFNKLTTSKCRGFLGALLLVMVAATGVILMIPVIQAKQHASSMSKQLRQQQTHRLLSQALEHWKDDHINLFLSTAFDSSMPINIFPRHLSELVDNHYLDLNLTSLHYCSENPSDPRDLTSSAFSLCDEWSNPVLYFVTTPGSCPLRLRYLANSALQLSITSKFVPTAVVVFQNHVAPRRDSSQLVTLKVLYENASRRYLQLFDELGASKSSELPVRLSPDSFTQLKHESACTLSSATEAKVSYITQNDVAVYCDDTVLTFDATTLSEKFALLSEESLQSVATAALNAWNTNYMLVLSREATKMQMSISQYIRHYFKLQQVQIDNQVYTTNLNAIRVCQETNYLTFGSLAVSNTDANNISKYATSVILPSHTSSATSSTETGFQRALYNILESAPMLTLNPDETGSVIRSNLPIRFECRCRTAGRNRIAADGASSYTNERDTSCFSSSIQDTYGIETADDLHSQPHYFSSMYLKTSIALDQIHGTCPSFDADDPLSWSIFN